MPKIWNNLPDDTGTLPQRPTAPRAAPRRAAHSLLQPTLAVPDGSSDGEEAKKAPELTPDQLKVFDTLTGQYMSNLEEAGLDKALGLDTQALKVKLGFDIMCTVLC